MSCGLDELIACQGTDGTTADSCFLGNSVCGVIRGREFERSPFSDEYRISDLPTSPTLYQFGGGSFKPVRTILITHIGSETELVVDLVDSEIPWLVGTKFMCRFKLALDFATEAPRLFFSESREAIPLLSNEHATFKIGSVLTKPSVITKPVLSVSETHDVSTPKKKSRVNVKPQIKSVDEIKKLKQIKAINLFPNKNDVSHTHTEKKSSTFYVSTNGVVEFFPEVVKKVHVLSHNSWTRLFGFLKSCVPLSVGFTSLDFRRLEQICQRVVESCPECSKFGSSVTPSTVLSIPKSKNQRGWVDVVTIDSSQSLKALVILDEGTRDSAIVLLEDETAESCWEAYLQGWASLHGPHQQLLSDGGGSFGSDRFRAYAQDLGTVKLCGPAQSPESFGIIERCVGVYRSSLDRLCLDPQGPKTRAKWRTALCVLQNSVRNETYVGGNSASERSIGTRSSLMTNVLSDSVSYPNHFSTLDLLKIKEATHRAFHASLNDAKLRAALREKQSRAPSASLRASDIHSGMIVEYRREPISGRGATWHSGRVLTWMEEPEAGNLVYILIETSSNPVRVSPRDLRLSHLNQNDNLSPIQIFEDKFDSQGTYVHPTRQAPVQNVPLTNSVERVVEAEVPDEPLPMVDADSDDDGDSDEVGSQDSDEETEEGEATFFAIGSKIFCGFTKTNSKYVCDASCVDGANLNVNEKLELLQSTPLWCGISSEYPGNPLTPMDAYNYSWDDLSREEQIKSRLKGVADYDEFAAWSRVDSVTDAELAEIMRIDTTVVKIATGWVDKAKIVDGKLIGRSRLVPKGFQDKLRGTVDNSSPTVNSSMLRIVENLAIREGWGACQLDFSSAFFQSAVICDRKIYIELPAEEIENGIKWRLLTKSVPGTNHGPRSWYNTICAYFLEIGFVRSKFDPCLFYYHRTGSLHIPVGKGQQGKKKGHGSGGVVEANSIPIDVGNVDDIRETPFCGFVPLHVDDGRARGTPSFISWLEYIVRKRFKLGDFTICTPGQTSEFTGKGFTDLLNPAGMVIDQNKYCEGKLKMVDVGLTGPELLSSYRSALGAAGWAVNNSQFADSYEVNLAAQKVHEEDLVSHAKQLNKTVALMQKDPLKTFIPKLPRKANVEICGIVDAGQTDKATWVGGQQGIIVGLMEPGSPLFALTHIKSGKLKRVTSGSFPAEAVAGHACLSITLVCQAIVCEFFSGISENLLERTLNPKLQNSRFMCDINMYSDSLGLVQNVNGEFNRSNLDSRRIEDIEDFRECRRLNKLKLVHINGTTNPSDALTKALTKCLKTYALLRTLLQTGRYEPDVSDAYTGHKLPSHPKRKPAGTGTKKS